jgi:hypothetical protein
LGNCAGIWPSTRNISTRLSRFGGHGWKHGPQLQAPHDQLNAAVNVDSSSDVSTDTSYQGN